MYYNVHTINHDPVMTLTYFKARSTWVAYAFEWGKLLKCHLKRKTCRKLANGQNIDYSQKIWPKSFLCPCTGAKYHNIQLCLLVYVADLRRTYTGLLALCLFSKLNTEQTFLLKGKLLFNSGIKYMYVYAHADLEMFINIGP